MKSKVFDLIEKENRRNVEGLEMIPSENYVSSDVLKALGSILVNKYSEGYPGARYYAGNTIIDEVEDYAKSLANKLFGTVHANVQPYSGSPANLAVLLSIAEIGETVMGLALSSGGHLTHGAEASFTSKLFKSVQYEVGTDGKIDMEKVRQLAISNKPKIIWVGGTAYPYILDFKSFAQIADEVGAFLVADISHIAGLIVAGIHASPVDYVDVITTTTHKTLRGPRGAMILVTEKGLKKDPELPTKVDKVVFPGLQGGPHENQIGALAVALEEASTPQFKKYSEQVVKNAKVLASKLGLSVSKHSSGISWSWDGNYISDLKTENHLLLWDLSKYGFGLGYQMHIALEMAGIYVNKNSVPGEKASAFYPSGIRLGTPALTSRGMKEKEMEKIAGFINTALIEVIGHDLPKEQEKRRDFIKNFRKRMENNDDIKWIREEVEALAKKFPVPGIK